MAPKDRVVSAEEFLDKIANVPIEAFDLDKVEAWREKQESRFKQPTPRHNEAAELVCDILNFGHRMTQWEKNFIDDMAFASSRKEPISDKQFAILKRVHSERVKR